MDFDVCIVGGGAAGLMASVFAAQSGVSVAVVESNTSVGRKILITGGGRCNITHDGSIDHFVRAFDFCGRFLKHSLYEFSPADAVEFFEGLGVKTKIEKDGLVFPKSDKAATVKNALLEKALSLGVKFIYGRTVESIVKDEDGFIVTAQADIIESKSVIIATGGKSWPVLGSTGDGYRFAKQLGHGIVEPIPALMGLVSGQQWFKKLQGVAVPEVKLSAKISGKKISAVGPMIFTDKGLGGPGVFEFTRFAAEQLAGMKGTIEVSIDLVAGQNEDEFRDALMSAGSENPRKKVLSFLSGFVPARLAGEMISQCDIDEDTPLGQLAKKKRTRLVAKVKQLKVSVSGTTGFRQATITRGGVDTKQIDPKTMESKICPGLFFAGEVMNVDGPCGGYNLQIAWSTGVLAGKCAAHKKSDRT